MMESSGNYSLKWSEHGTIFSKSLRNLHTNHNFSDVTLACEDGKQIQAHKVILSACSVSFQSILLRNAHPHPLLYLKGVKSHHLSSIIDFIYTGEVTVMQDILEELLETARELKIMGLSNENHAEVKPEKQEAKSDEGEMEIPSGNIDPKQEDNIARDDALRPSQDFEVNDMFEKVDLGLWQCQVCQKTSKQKGDMKKHLEIHLERVSYPCEICGKSYMTRRSLMTHKSNSHRDLNKSN